MTMRGGAPSEPVLDTAPRVLVADDHLPIRVAVREALELDGIMVCGEADTAYMAVDLARRTRPDVCLLDITMPGGGLWALHEIRGHLPGTPCVMLTVSDSSEDLIDALREGALGYLLKDCPSAAVPAAVRAVLNGEAVLSGKQMALALAGLRSGAGSPHTLTDLQGRRVRFTDRETEVFDLLLEGRSTGQIASHLFIRQITVRRHVAEALHKLGVASRAEGIELVRAQRSTPSSSTW